MKKIKVPYNKYSPSTILALPTNSPKYLQIVIKARNRTLSTETNLHLPHTVNLITHCSIMFEPSVVTKLVNAVCFANFDLTLMLRVFH